jgi:NhaA family Na+:H+ antiporter
VTRPRAQSSVRGRSVVRDRVVARVLGPFQEFARTGSLGGIVLLGCTIAALGWANSPWRDGYLALWAAPIDIGPASHPLRLSVRGWINDGLMAVFFLQVGLEMKREFLAGELASARQAILPIAGAVGGMVLPASIYFALNAGGEAARGWGIPMATDIAFALGVLALLGPRLPLGLKVFLVALAIVDDLGAVLVIAGFYTKGIDPHAIAFAGAIMVVLLVLNRTGIRALRWYLALGAVLWIAVHESGVHATIAGVLLALAIPARSRIDADEFSERVSRLIDDFRRGETGDRRVLTSTAQQEALNALGIEAAAVIPPLLRLEHLLHGPVSFGIMPLFALANAGVELTTFGNAFSSPVGWGVALGLLLGKTSGITLFAWMAVRAGVAILPTGVGWRLLYAASWLGGIGFTMAIFVAGLAFTDVRLIETAKAGVLAASACAGIVGYVLLSIWKDRGRCGS